MLTVVNENVHCMLSVAALHSTDNLHLHINLDVYLNMFNLYIQNILYCTNLYILPEYLEVLCVHNDYVTCKCCSCE